MDSGASAPREVKAVWDVQVTALPHVAPGASLAVLVHPPAQAWLCVYHFHAMKVV